MKALFIPLLFLSVFSTAQAVLSIDGAACNTHGSAKAGSNTYYLNAYKNRYTFPQATDFDKHITLKALLQSADPNRFSPDKAVRLQGFVFNVKMGGVESCNCKTKNPAFRDTHIELTPDETKTAPEYRLIAEVTPRLRALMARKGVDWSTEGLRKTLKGRKVVITGWLLYDAEHEGEAFANDPQDAIGGENWRATCWEIHPVTNIEFLSAASRMETDTANSSAPTGNVPPGQQPEERPGYPFLTVLLVLAVVLLVILYIRRRK